MYLLSQNRHLKFSIMTKVLDVLAERFRQNPLEIHFCKQHPPGG